MEMEANRQAEEEEKERKRIENEKKLAEEERLRAEAEAEELKRAERVKREAEAEAMIKAREEAAALNKQKAKDDQVSLKSLSFEGGLKYELANGCMSFNPSFFFFPLVNFIQYNIGEG